MIVIEFNKKDTEFQKYKKIIDASKEYGEELFVVYKKSGEISNNKKCVLTQDIYTYYAMMIISDYIQKVKQNRYFFDVNKFIMDDIISYIGNLSKEAYNSLLERIDKSKQEITKKLEELNPLKPYTSHLGGVRV